MWQAIYESPWHHPIACWLAAAALLGWLIGAWRRIDVFHRGWLLTYVAIVATDAAVTGNWALLSDESPLRRQLALGLTVAGQGLFFLICERAAAGPRLGWLTALGWTLLTPLAHEFATHGWWQDMASSLRHSPDAALLLYDAGFLAAVLVYRLVWLRRRLRGRPDAARLAMLATFQVVQAAAFLVADGLNQFSAQSGDGLRTLPSLMYYVGFMWLVALTAPAPDRPLTAPATAI